MRFSRRSLRSISAVGLCLFGVVAWSQTRAKAGAIPEIKNYTAWRQVTDKPFDMAPIVAMACAPASFSPPEGPHEGKLIRVYVNKAGEKQMMTQKKPHFPPGSVVVKQKWGRVPSKNSKADDSQNPKLSSSPELLTVMIKHEPGYAPATGDWEYMVTDGAGEKVTERGQIESCQGCHRPYKATDYVTRVYLPKEVREALKDLDSATAKKPGKSK